MGFLASREKAAFFSDSATYVMKWIRPNQNTHDDLARDTYRIRSDNTTSKFNPVTKYCVVFQLDSILLPEALPLKKDKSPHAVASALAEYARTHLDMRYAEFKSPFTAFVIGYDDAPTFGEVTKQFEMRKQIIGYMIDPSRHNIIKDQHKYNFNPCVLGLPTFYISLWVEPFRILCDWIKF